MFEIRWWHLLSLSSSDSRRKHFMKPFALGQGSQVTVKTQSDNTFLIQPTNSTFWGKWYMRSMWMSIETAKPLQKLQVWIGLCDMTRAHTSEGNTHKPCAPGLVQTVCSHCRQTSNEHLHVVALAPAAIRACHIFATQLPACKKPWLSAPAILSPVWPFPGSSVYFVSSPTSL